MSKRKVKKQAEKRKPGFQLPGWKSLLLAAVPLALLAVIYYPTFVWMVDRWMARDSYYSHGFLIPIVTAYWIFKRQDRLRAAEVRTEPMGLPVLAAGILLQLLCSFLRIYFLSAFSFILVLIGAIYFLFGRKVLKEVWFPLFFLSLMVPLPLLVISEVTLKMKFFVAEISTWLINQAGIPAVREGSYIRMRSSYLIVGDPCSGLRSFLAFLCLGLVFAYDSGLALWKKFALTGMGLPVALLSNIGRVFVLGLSCQIYGMEFTHKWIHDASGFVAFGVAFAMFIFLRKELESIRAGSPA